MADALAPPDEPASPAPGLRTGELAPSLLFWMLVLFLILEYARPPGIVRLHLQMLITVALPVLCISRLRHRPWSGILTAQVLLVLTCAQAVAFASNSYAAYVTTRVMFGNVAIALSMAWLLASREAFRRGIWAWLLIMGYVALYGVYPRGSRAGWLPGR